MNKLYLLKCTPFDTRSLEADLDLIEKQLLQQDNFETISARLNKIKTTLDEWCPIQDCYEDFKYVNGYGIGVYEFESF